MKAGTFRFEVAPDLPALTTRPQGIRARKEALELLISHEALELDFCLALVTPSFVDEFIGGLLDELGEEQFRTRLTITNPTPQTIPLIRHVLHHRRVRRAVSAA